MDGGKTLLTIQYRAVAEHLMCGLCNDVLIDPQTTLDCLHSFCR